ncbi:UDP-glucose 4-epimerase [Sporomusa carbonis]
MRILLVGGAGDVGKHVARYLCQKGHKVIILDKNEVTISPETGNNLAAYKADLTDVALVKDLVVKTDVIVNLAWSFSDDPRVLFSSDIGGHINLLEAASTEKNKRLIYTSTAGVYGTPPPQIIDEDYVCRPERARKPLYAIAKHCAEQLSLTFGRDRGVPATVFRFWWAFGDAIGGKHLRELINLALSGQPLRMVNGAGGVFVSMDDLGAAIELAAQNEQAIGQIYNIGSLFLSWKEIGQMIIELTGSQSPLELVDSKHWSGPAFLNETWQLSWDKAAREIGYRPQLSETAGRAAFQKALAACIAALAK